MDERIIPFLPSYVDLYFVDYDQNLRDSPDLLQECINENSLNPIGFKIDDWWEDCYTIEKYLDDVKSDMMEGLEGMEEEDIEALFDDNEDEIREWIYDHDKSTPVEDLLHNTGVVTMFYSLGVEFGGYSAGDIGMQQYNIRRKLGIKKDSAADELINSIILNSYSGGELRIYFKDNIVKYQSESECDFKQITFTGKFVVALFHAGEGSGFFEEIELNKSFEFKRENLFVSDSEKYNLEDCFGMCGDWLNKFASPTPSCIQIKRGTKIKASNALKRIEQDAKYNKVYKSGKCTYGDMDYRRHRGITYSNEYPCGSKCPHCGTFWID